jgi:hypothetical protein
MLTMEGIEHRTKCAARRRATASPSRCAAPLLDERFCDRGSQNHYVEPAEVRRDPNVFLHFYNLEQRRQAYGLKGRTPAKSGASADVKNFTHRLGGHQQ